MPEASDHERSVARGATRSKRTSPWGKFETPHRLMTEPMVALRERINHPSDISNRTKPGGCGRGARALNRLQRLDGLISVLLAQFPQIKRLLHTQPDLWTIAEGLAQTHRHVWCHRSLLVNQFGDAQPRHADPISKIFLGHLERWQDVLSQNSPGVRWLALGVTQRMSSHQR